VGQVVRRQSLMMDNKCAFVSGYLLPLIYGYKSIYLIIISGSCEMDNGIIITFRTIIIAPLSSQETAHLAVYWKVTCKTSDTPDRARWAFIMFIKTRSMSCVNVLMPWRLFLILSRHNVGDGMHVGIAKP